MIGEQSLVQRSVWTGNGVEELFSRSRVVELAGELSTVKSSSKLPRISDPSDKVKPEHLPAGEISEKPKSSSSPDEVDKSRGPDSSGPRRRLGQKTGAVAKDEYEKFSDEFERGLDRAVEMELGKSGSSKDRRPKGDDVEYSPSYTSEGLLTRIASGLRHAKLREAGFPRTQQESQVHKTCLKITSHLF